MEISDDKTIRQIQEEFHEKFPYLRLEFYKEEHQAGEGSPEAAKLDPDKTIGEARKKHNEGDLNVQGNLKVSTLEKNFHDKYGLNVQVFRRSGELWLQTISTDEWTLKEQNEKGMKSMK